MILDLAAGHQLTEEQRLSCLRSPVEKVEWVHRDTLTANGWNPNMVLKPELRLLQFSIRTSGWIQPLLVSRERTIVDGFHRWCLSGEPGLLERYGGFVPVVELDLDEPEAMLLTVRINRAKGKHAAVRMADLVKSLLNDHGYDPQEVAQGIGATLDEVKLLGEDSVFKARSIDRWQYSDSWVPEKC